MTKHLLLALAVVVGLGVAVPSPAAAHPDGNPIRLSIGLPVLQVDHFPDLSFTTIGYGIRSTTFGLDLGYQITEPLGIVVRVLAGGTRTEGGPGRTNFTVVTIGAVPRVEYMFVPHSQVGFYVGAQAGVTWTGDPSVMLFETIEGGGFVGAHVFASRSQSEFSVDFEAAVGGTYQPTGEFGGLRVVLYVSTTGWLD